MEEREKSTSEGIVTQRDNVTSRKDKLLGDLDLGLVISSPDKKGIFLILFLGYVILLVPSLLQNNWAKSHKNIWQQ